MKYGTLWYMDWYFFILFVIFRRIAAQGKTSCVLETFICKSIEFLQQQVLSSFFLTDGMLVILVAFYLFPIFNISNVFKHTTFALNHFTNCLTAVCHGGRHEVLSYHEVQYLIANLSIILECCKMLQG